MFFHTTATNHHHETAPEAIACAEKHLGEPLVMGQWQRDAFGGYVTGLTEWSHTAHTINLG